MTKLNTPILVINFKNYPRALGRGAIELSKVAEKVSRDLSVSIAVAPPQPTLLSVANSVDIPVLAQHVDDVRTGSTTGYIPIESISRAGAAGSIINHSEHKIPHEAVVRIVEMLREYGLTSVVCASDVSEAEALASSEPDFIAVEPPELIGTGRAVSKVSPEVISRSVEMVSIRSSSTTVLCGAGIVSGEDVSAALRLGAEGVLVASGIVKSDDPEAKIREMAMPLRL